MIGFESALCFPSDNHGKRRGSLQPSMIIIHYTGMQSVQAALERLCSPEFEVSSHYLISAQGEIFQLVSEDRRAWHAGLSYWRGWQDINSRSIGIELDNVGDQPFPFPQMRSLISLCKDIQCRWSIWPVNVLGHSDVSVTRKVDPGSKFDWESLARAGVGIWPENSTTNSDIAPSKVNFLKNAELLGYDISNGLTSVLAAVRCRFSPYRSGPLGSADCALMDRLLTAFSIDQG